MRTPVQTPTPPPLAATTLPGSPTRTGGTELTASRGVRSYVVRAGRITPAQQRALEELWPRYGVDLEGGPLDLSTLFGRQAPCTLEIGFGNGDNLLARATAEPERDFLGVEVHRPGVGHLLLGAADAQLSNLRVIVHDAVSVVQQLPAGALEEVQVLFPDPWPKKRHHKRRLLQPAFIARLTAALRPAGRLHIVTDWQPYAEQIAVDLEACEALMNAAQLPQLTASSRLATRFERRGTRLGHGIHEFLYVPRR
jgi:tRNA (guanine-N7-)-methyltransferase